MRAAEFMRALADIIDALERGGNASLSNNKDDNELQDNPVFMSPQQQQIELEKAEQGKSNPAIDKLIASNDIGEEGQNSEPTGVGTGANNVADMAQKQGTIPLSLVDRLPGVR